MPNRHFGTLSLMSSYAIQLLTPSNVLSNINGGEEIGLEEIKQVQDLFFDAKTSARILREKANEYL